MSLPLEQWPSEAVAAAQLQTSTKTIHRYAAVGKIELRKRPRPGKRPENVVNPHDLERLMPKVHIMREESAESEPTAVTAVNQERLTFAYVLKELLERTAAPRLPPALLPWISLEEASAASGLSPGCLRRAIREKKIEAIRGGPHGALRIRRASLEAFAG